MAIKLLADLVQMGRDAKTPKCSSSRGSAGNILIIILIKPNDLPKVISEAGIKTKIIMFK